MILVLKHVAIEGPGSIGPFLSRGRWEVRVIELALGQELPDRLEGIEAVVCLGGPMNVYEEAAFPFLKQEDAFIKNLVKENIPFLGICLGAQLLSKACGGKVVKAVAREMGWSQVSLTSEGAHDLLFKKAPRSLSVFQWHEDTFTIPAGGALLATSSLCRNQAFRIGNRAYGLQFHLEVTSDMVASWVAAHDQGQGEPVNGERMLAETFERAPAYEEQAAGIYRNLEQIIRG